MGSKPCKYTPEIISEICAELEQGRSAKDTCRRVNIAEDTFYTWMKEHPEFAERVKAARKVYDDWERNELVKDCKLSLKELIRGAEVTDTQTEYEPGKDGEPRIRRQITKTRRQAPNATAIIFALSNRDPEHWQNKYTQELTGKVQTVPAEDELSKLSDDVVERLNRILDGKD